MIDGHIELNSARKNFSRRNLGFARKNAEAVKQLMAVGVTLHDWAPSERAKFRASALKAWETWKTKSPEAAQLIEMHKAYMKANGIL